MHAQPQWHGTQNASHDDDDDDDDDDGDDDYDGGGDGCDSLFVSMC